MTTLFFGDPKRPLFGSFHQASTTGRRRAGILLCYPAPQEYMFAHRAFRRLAEELARKGHPVLRFDYTGTGDSASDLEDATLSAWRADVVTAADELGELANVDQVSVVGMRLGASLAATVSAEGRRFREIVLWDPIVSGRRAVEELRAIDDQRYAMSHVKRDPPPIDELCGFPFPAQLRRELDRLDLLQLPRLATSKVLLLASSDDPEMRLLERRLASAGNDVALSVVPDPEALEKRASLGESLLSRTMIDAVLERIAS